MVALSIALFIWLITATILPGGYDAYHFFLRPWWTGATVPAYAYFATAPFAGLAWPWPWALWGLASIGMFYAACRALGNRWWPAVLISAPVLVNLWLGQMGLFTVGGMLLGWWALRKGHAALMSIAILALLVKPQAGALLALYYAWQLWREQGWRGLAWMTGGAGAVLAVSLLVYGWWPSDFWRTLTTFGFTRAYWNAAVWPWGLLALSALALPATGERARLRVILAANLLAAPYVSVYHGAALAVLTKSPLLVLTILLVWAMPFAGFQVFQAFPLAVIAVEAGRAIINRRARSMRAMA